MVVILGIVSSFQASFHVEFKKTSIKVEKLSPPLMFVGNKENGISKKNLITTDFIDQTFSILDNKILEIYSSNISNHYYLQIYELNNTKRFFFLI